MAKRIHHLVDYEGWQFVLHKKDGEMWFRRIPEGVKYNAKSGETLVTIVSVVQLTTLTVADGLASVSTSVENVAAGFENRDVLSIADIGLILRQFSAVEQSLAALGPVYAWACTMERIWYPTFMSKVYEFAAWWAKKGVLFRDWHVLECLDNDMPQLIDLSPKLSEFLLLGGTMVGKPSCLAVLRCLPFHLSGGVCGPVATLFDAVSTAFIERDLAGIYEYVKNKPAFFEDGYAEYEEYFHTMLLLAVVFGGLFGLVTGVDMPRELCFSIRGVSYRLEFPIE